MTLPAHITTDLQWIRVAPCTAIPTGLGVGALIQGQQLAIFRCGDGSLRAISNYDPIGAAHVLARGLIGQIRGQRVVASPLYKQHYDLDTGRCLEEPQVLVPIFPVREEAGYIEIGVAA